MPTTSPTSADATPADATSTCPNTSARRASDPAPPQSEPARPSPDSKSFLTSRTFAGLALVLLPILAEKLGLHLDDAAAQKIVEELFQAGGCVLAAYGRWKASQPLHVGTPSNGASLLLALAAALALLLSACARTTTATLLH